MFFERMGLRVFVYKSEIDMRCGFERLHSLCVHQMQAIMDQGHVYVFFGKNRRRIKVLFYDGSGLVLIAKRIERGRFMSLSDLLNRSEIKLSELKQIMHGSVIRSPVLDRSGTHPHVMKVDINRGTYQLTNLETNTVHLIMNKQGIINGPCSYKKVK